MNDELSREAEKMITTYELKTPFALLGWEVENAAEDVRSLLRKVEGAVKIEVSVDEQNRVGITYTMIDGKVTRFWTEDLKNENNE